MLSGDLGSTVWLCVLYTIHPPQPPICNLFSINKCNTLCIKHILSDLYFVISLQNLVKESWCDFWLRVFFLIRASFCQLRFLSKIKHILFFSPDLEKVMHAFISSRLDYWYVLYAGLNETSMPCLQLVQCSSKGFNGHKEKRAVYLHWLPDDFRMNFKIYFFLFKALKARLPTASLN